MAEIIDGMVVVRETSKERVVYFVQAQELRLIKIGDYALYDTKSPTGRVLSGGLRRGLALTALGVGA